jgi:hypothetical protein
MVTPACQHQVQGPGVVALISTWGSVGQEWDVSGQNMVYDSVIVNYMFFRTVRMQPAMEWFMTV